MRVTAVDERDSSGLVESPVFRVFDWVGEGALSGETTRLHAYDIAEADVWAVLDWVRAERDPSPSLSELYACVPDADGVTLVFLGSVVRVDGEVRTSSMRL